MDSPPAGTAARRTLLFFPIPLVPSLPAIDAIWLAAEPMDMRGGTDTALARVVAVFGAAKPHCAYLF
ncbi:hypothetical protein, partial [Pseudomonas nitroreducens]|uniref:hypothetical protein n=1 Tax=Pseudomonas nitroreducens TaxID=46680 RepID=UPI001C878A5D